MVIMASGIARGRVRTTATTTTTTESRNVAAILQIIGWQRHAALVYRVLLWYWTSMLSSIDTCQNKVSADQYHVTISRAQVYRSSRSRFFLNWPLTKCWFSIGSRVHVSLTCWKQGRIVRKPVNADPGLRVNRIITFSSIQMFFFFFCFVLRIWWLLKLKTEGQTIYRKPHCKVRWNQNSTFAWASLIGLWTTRPRSYALGWPKSILIPCQHCAMKTLKREYQRGRWQVRETEVMTPEK